MNMDILFLVNELFFVELFLTFPIKFNVRLSKKKKINVEAFFFHFYGVSVENV